MKKTLLLVLGSFCLIMILFATTSAFFTSQLHEKQTLLVKIDRLAQHTQEHKDQFSMFSKHVSLFDSVAKNPLKFQVGSQLFYLQTKKKLHFISTDDFEQKLSGKFLRLKKLEGAVLTDVQHIGFKEFGAVGKMRTVVHQLETDFPQYNEPLLSLRRHEKDYIMRLDARYAEKFNLEITDWQNRGTAPIGLIDYQRFFENSKFYFEDLYHVNHARYPQWLNQIDHIQQDIRTTRSELLMDSYQISSESLHLQYLISGLSIALLLLGSFTFIKRFSRQVAQVQNAMSEFIASNYESKQLFDGPIPKNEIGVISLHFIQMARKIRSDLQLLEDRVARRTRTLKEKNELLEQQHDEIVESLKYAQNLQQSLLVSRNRLLTNFHEAWIHYAPKNLVGGDFFWMKEFIWNDQETVLFALADCTGHGVPGALLSVMGMNTLDELFALGIREPADLLNELRLTISRRLNAQSDKRLDGMDISLFMLNKETGALTFAGAQMPLWILRKREIIELKGQRTPIGFTYGELLAYENQHIQLAANDRLLLFTDGLVDQFGEISNKKMGKKELRGFIERNNSSNCSVFFHKLSQYFQQWKGQSEQTDDCTFILFEFLTQQDARNAEKTTQALIYTVFA